MVLIRQTFPEIIKPVEAFSFTDIATGKGYATFFAGMASGAAIVDHVPANQVASGAHILSTTAFFSTRIATMKQNDSTTAIVNLEPFFDVKFTVPRVIEGVMLGEIPNGEDRNANSDARSIWNEVDVIRFDGTNETSLVSGVTQVFKGASSGVNRTFLNVYLDIPRTNFEIGDSLRIRVRQWVIAGSTSGIPMFAMGHDPQNRDHSAQQKFDIEGVISTRVPFPDGFPTRMSFQIPFVIGA